MFKSMNDNSKVFTKTQAMAVLVLTLFLSITSATYAYFAIDATDNSTITGEAATVNLTLNVERVFPTESSINTGVMVPQLSTSGSDTSPLAIALKNGCIDANQNVVCQVYHITIQNLGGTATQVVDGSVSFYSDSAMTTNVTTIMPNLKWKLITSANATTPSSSVLGTNEDRQANSTVTDFDSNLTLVTNAMKEYYMIVWINETNSDQTDKSATSTNPKIFYGLIEFNSSNGTGVTSTFTP